MPRIPNILWICTDQQRFDTIHALGNPIINTPNLDRLVSEGVSFTRAYAQSPVCSPSRASFLTGRYPRTTKCRQNGQEHFPVSEKLVTKTLADHGYDCGLIGKLHLSACDGRKEERIDDGYRVFHWSHDPFPCWIENEYIQWLKGKGYEFEDVYPLSFNTPRDLGFGIKNAPVYAGVPSELHQTTWCAEKAIEFIKEPHNGPWLLSVNPFDPHNPFDPPEEYMRRYDPDKIPSPSYQEGELENKPIYQRIDHRGAYGGRGISFANMTDYERRQVIAAYYAMVELIDSRVGWLLDALEETNQRRDTLVIFTSDHGEMLGDHGIFCKGPYFYEPAIRVPLILSWPGHFSEGLRSDALVELVDLAPTLLDVAGIETTEDMQGKSLVPICSGKATPNYHRNHVYCEYYNALVSHTDPVPYATMLRDSRYKIVVFHNEELGELYDLELDPNEFANLWNDKEYMDIKNTLLKRCFDASVFTMDPMPRRVGAY